MDFTHSFRQLANRFNCQFPLIIAVIVVCNGSVRAEDTASNYCMNAGAENDFDCSKAITVNTEKTDFDNKLSELTQWLEGEERVIKGDSSLAQRQLTTANDDLQKKIDFNTKLLAAELKKAHALQSQGNYGAAFTQINNYLVRHPADPNGWLLYGIALIDQNKLPAAEDIFKKLIELYPNAPEPYNNLAAIYARRGENKRAIDTLFQAFNTHPSYAQIYQNLKTVYGSLANQAYNQALNPGDSPIAPRPNLTIISQVYRTDSTPVKNTPLASSKTPSPIPESIAQSQSGQAFASQMPINTELVIEERQVSEGITPDYRKVP